MPSRFRRSTEFATVLGSLLLIGTIAPEGSEPVRPPPDCREGARELALQEQYTIGHVIGPDEYTFGRIPDLTVSSDDDIWVIDAPAQSVKVYDPSGEFRFAVGRAGEGPGEFRRPGELVTTDSSVKVFDPALHRVNEYSNDGRRLDSRRAPAIEGLNIGVFHYVRGSTALIKTTARLSFGSDSHEPRTLVGLSRTEDGESRLDTLLHYHSGAIVYHPEQRTLPWGVTSGPFGPAGAVATPSDSLVAVVDGYGGVVALHELSATGVPRQRAEIMLPLNSRSVTDDDVETFETTFLDQRETPLGYDPVFETPPRWSVGTDALFSGSDELWVQNGRSRECSPVWTIVDLETHRIERVTLPEEFRLLDVNGDALLGVVRPELEVPLVRVYRRLDR